jgi:hypothetical protein
MANHLYQSSWSTHQKHKGARARSYYVTLFSGGAQLLYCGCGCSQPVSGNCAQHWQAKDDAFFVVETDQYVLTFLHSILVCRGGGHTLSTSTAGDDAIMYPTVCGYMSHLTLSLLLTRVWVNFTPLEPWLYYDLKKGCHL